MGYGYYTREIDGLERHLGYCISALCDHPDCSKVIDRGLAYVCGGEPGETENGCGRYFCEEHIGLSPKQCERCLDELPPWPMKGDLPDALDDIRWNTPKDEAEAKALSERSRQSRGPHHNGAI